MSVRPAAAGDVPAVLELWAVARSAAASTPDTAEAVLRLLAHTPDALLVAERDGRIVGSLIAAWDGWRGSMYRLAVLPELRREGIARRLVEAGHERLRARGARRITALVDQREAEAVAFWLALGYPLEPDLGRHVGMLGPVPSPEPTRADDP